MGDTLADKVIQHFLKTEIKAKFGVKDVPENTTSIHLGLQAVSNNPYKLRSEMDGINTTPTKYTSSKENKNQWEYFFPDRSTMTVLYEAPPQPSPDDTDLDFGKLMKSR